MPGQVTPAVYHPAAGSDNYSAEGILRLASLVLSASFSHSFYPWSSSRSAVRFSGIGGLIVEAYLQNIIGYNGEETDG